MLTQADFEAKLVANITDHKVLQLYQANDPHLLQQLRSIAAYLTLLSKEMDVATLEPFIKTRDRSIIADATNKGILPTGTACRHLIEVINNGENSVTLTQGRVIEDNSGSRPWRLMQSVTVLPKTISEVAVEQSEYREIPYKIPMTEPFHRKLIELQDDLHLCAITVHDTELSRNQYRIEPRWMNVAKLDYVVNITTDDLRRLILEWGDSQRAGRTAYRDDVFTLGITETYGYVDTSRLKDASLIEVYHSDEQKTYVRFKTGGLIREGANPLSVEELRLIASYPSLYDENSVFLGNFNYLVRTRFMKRAYYINVWNENVQERYYGVSIADINHLHLSVVAKNPLEQSVLEDEIKQLIGRADNLYQDRVKTKNVTEKPYQITINGSLSSVHDLDGVKTQIKGLLVEKYGRNSLASTRWVINGFNSQEMGKLLKDNIIAFQDRISDFTILPSHDLNLPHEWVYITPESVVINLERTADTIGASWNF